MSDTGRFGDRRLAKAPGQVGVWSWALPGTHTKVG